ncbi:unnamed protein product [Tetraodon nigroviridis]|uniref:Chromosome undetermined SCAF2943, whole genome shotgun sequence n=1 Tax=Tetraodon nigroviridis TaxID=99883 RepID=Q4THH3_TETNG|nr:unnamed protein product [Tetraodon nigroviridis]
MLISGKRLITNSCCFFLYYSGPRLRRPRDPERSGPHLRRPRDPERSRPHLRRPRDPERSGPRLRRPRDPEWSGPRLRRPRDPERSGPRLRRPRDPERSGPRLRRPRDPERSGPRLRRPRDLERNETRPRLCRGWSGAAFGSSAVDAAGSAFGSSVVGAGAKPGVERPSAPSSSLNMSNWKFQTVGGTLQRINFIGDHSYITGQKSNHKEAFINMNADLTTKC